MNSDALEGTERIKYESMFRQDWYRRKNHGLEAWRQRRAWLTDSEEAALKRVVDLGCGTGRLVKHWIEKDGLDAMGIDIAYSVSVDPEILSAYPDRFGADPLWSLRRGQWDFGMCADVMEHIPPAMVRSTLHAIAQACRRVYFQTALFRHDHSGNKLHLTVRTHAWWRDMVQDIMPGTITDLGMDPGGQKSLLYWVA